MLTNFFNIGCAKRDLTGEDVEPQLLFRLEFELRKNGRERDLVNSLEASDYSSRKHVAKYYYVPMHSITVKKGCL